ncbi:MAG: hypothetical protein ABIK25_07445 [Pseudomonadota bacterium]
MTEDQIKIHKPINIETSVAEFVAKTINENMLPLRNILVYPHLAGGQFVGKEVESSEPKFSLCKMLSKDIEAKVKEIGFNAQRFQVEEFIDPKMLGKTLKYEDDGDGCLVVETQEAIEKKCRQVNIVTPFKFVGPVFSVRGKYACILIPKTQNSLDSCERSHNAVLGDLVTAINPISHFGTVAHVFELKDHQYGEWLFGFSRWTEEIEKERRERFSA